MADKNPSTHFVTPPGLGVVYPSSPADHLIVALDVPDRNQAQALVRQLVPLGVITFKVGKRLFYAEGPSILWVIHQQGGKVFLDLKLHDIPNTVAQAVESLVEHQVWMLNVHALGGRAMMAQAVESAQKTAQAHDLPCPIMTAVTVLTSHDETFLREEWKQDRPVDEMVHHFAGLAQSAGLNGVVCSPHEAQDIADTFGTPFLRVTPGIRPASGADANDQKRIMTPFQALEQGSSYMVVGRPIIAAPDPVAATQGILDDITQWYATQGTAPSSPSPL